MNYIITFNTSTGFITGWYQTTSNNFQSGQIVTDQATFDSIVSSLGAGWSVVNNALVAPTAASLLLYTQQQQIQILKQSCTNAIYNGFQITVNGSPYTITLRENDLSHDQTNNLLNSISAQTAMSQAKVWAANTTVPPNYVVTDGNGKYWITFAGGTTGSTIPAMPVNYSVGVTDNTVVWYLMGFRVNTTEGTIFIDPITLVSLAGQMAAFINQILSTYDGLKTQVMSATTPAAVQAIVW